MPVFPRPRASRALATASFLAAAMLAPRAAHATWPHDPGVNVSTNTSTNVQEYFTPNSAAPDGAGGMFLTWTEQVGVQLDIHAQHLTADGLIAPGWPAAGLVVSSIAGNKRRPVVIPDGSGGALIAWDNDGFGSGDIFAQHLLANGTVATGWPAGGLDLSVANEANTEFGPQLTPDGAGGALVVWTYVFSGSDNDVYGAHVTGAGAIAWSHALYQPGGIQDFPHAVPDGAGGMLVSFDDNLSGNFDINVMRIASGGSTVWGPVAIVSAPGDQEGNRIASDGAGGAYIAWTDVGSVPISVEIGRLTSTGVPQGSGWFSSGARPVTVDLTAQQDTPVLAPDGAGGCFVAWNDARNLSVDTFVQRLTPNGFFAVGWPGDGLAALSSATDATMIADGSGGVLLAVAELGEVRAIRLTASGAVASGWPYAGTVVAGAGDVSIGSVALVSDGGSGALVGWPMDRTAPTSHVYAQNVDGFGALGDARPAITKLADVPNDQGGSVSLQWTASYLDALPARSVGQYTLWRRVPGGTAALAAARARAARTGHALRATGEGAQVVFWEYVATQPARAFPGYSAVVVTTSDSLPGGNPLTSFMVQAEAQFGVPYWGSAPDSGYSVDNLPPAVPAPFTGAYAAGATHLHWGENHEADLAGYRLYRGASAGFVPGPGNLIATQPDTGFDDAGAAGSWYKLAAVDVHGNPSGFAVLGPSGTLNAPGGAVTELSFAPPSPNPVRGAGAVFRIGLPAEARVSLVVFDQQGRQVRELARGDLPAGVRILPWDGRDDAGHMAPSGIYFARLEVAGRRLTERFALLR